MTDEYKCHECQYFRMRGSLETEIYYECKHFESKVEFNGDVCNKFTIEKDIFNIW